MRFILLLLLFLPGLLCAADKTVSVAVNIGPPWAYYKDDKGITGIDVEIIRTVFGNLGYETEFHVLAYHRLIKEFNQGQFDVASPAAFPPDNGYLTARYLPFEDVVVSLEKKQLNIEKIDDLRGKRIIGYQFAKEVLGEEYRRAVEDANYLEIAEREVQLTLLVNDRTEVVIGERRLLEYITRNKYPEVTLSIHPVFEVKSYGAIIKDKRLQQQFDQELARIIASGVYQDILDKWP